MAGKFILKKTTLNNFVFILTAPNGQNILTGEAYPSKNAALMGIESVRKNAGKKSHFSERLTKDKKPFFVLIAPNGEIIGRSEIHSSTISMRNAIASVMANARSAALEDATA